MKVELWNDNHEEYSEKWRGETIRIPAKGHVKMERAKAIAFKGTFSGMDQDSGMPKVKMLRVFEDPKQRDLRLKQPTTESHLCNACGHEFLSGKELQTHVEVHHQDQLLKEEKKNGPRKK